MESGTLAMGDDMTTIRTTCDRCGDVELTTEDLGLLLDADGEQGRYRFTCPLCGDVQHRPANHRVVSILLATGVRYEIVSAPRPISEEEIVAFARALDRDDWFEELVMTDL